MSLLEDFLEPEEALDEGEVLIFEALEYILDIFNSPEFAVTKAKIDKENPPASIIPPQYYHPMRRVYHELKQDLCDRLPKGYGLKLDTDRVHSHREAIYHISDENGKKSGKITLTFDTNYLRVIVDSKLDVLTELAEQYSGQNLLDKRMSATEDVNDLKQRIFKMIEDMPSIDSIPELDNFKDVFNYYNLSHITACYLMFSEPLNVEELRNRNFTQVQIDSAKKKLEDVIGPEYFRLADKVYGPMP